MPTDAWGIDDEYEDALHQRRVLSPETRDQIRAAMQIDPRQEAPDETPVRVLLPGDLAPAIGPGELVLEDGTRIDVGAKLPRKLPLGYHDFFPSGGGPN